MEKQERKDIRRILNTVGVDHLLELLGKRIPLSDLNTLLLELFRNVTNDTTPFELLKRYSSNRFVHPAELDPIELKRLEIELLETARSSSFEPIQLSPVAPLGSCSVVATADQNKIISAIRGTEVVADATNVLALHICDSIKSGRLKNDEHSIRFSTTHRHVRAQKFDKPGLVTHFHVFCLVSSGKDSGSYTFEKENLREHLTVYRNIFKNLYDSSIKVSLNRRGGYKDPDGFMQRVSDYIKEHSPDMEIIENNSEVNNEYYKGLQFSIFIDRNGQEVNIGDGGFVDWSQKMLNSKKERMMISAIGLDRNAAVRKIVTYGETGCAPVEGEGLEQQGGSG